MRVFDVEEKAIIRKITEGNGYSRNLINILDSINTLQGIRIQINRKNRSAEYIFQIQNTEPSVEEQRWAIEKQKQVMELLIKHLMLFRYLEKEELAIFFQSARSDDQVITFGAGAENLPPLRMSFDDQNVIDLLIKYVHKEIMPSPSLRKLEKNKYISDEEIKFNKQFKATWAAIIVSTFLGLYGMYSNYQNGVTQEKQFKVQITENKKTAESIIEKLVQLEKSKIDYSLAIDKVSVELSKMTDKVNLLPKNKTIQELFLKERKATKK